MILASDLTILEYISLVHLDASSPSLRLIIIRCSIRTSVNQQIKTVGHIPREISRQVNLFLKDEHGHIDETVKSIDCRPSPIPAGGLEIPLTSTHLITMKIKNMRDERDKSSSDEEINLLINVGREPEQQ